MHVQFEKSCKKGQKCIFHFELYTKKKAKMKKKKAHYFGICLILYHLCQDKNVRKSKKMFQIPNPKKGRKYYFKKIMQKSRTAKKG